MAAPWIHFSLWYSISIVIFFSFVIEQSTTAFTIKLIHRYAPESPFYNVNLTDQETVERVNFQTKPARKQNTSLIISTAEENETLLDLQAIRPSLDFEDNPPLSAFLVKVSIGTFSNRGGASHKSYYLDLDTGSTITWLQCEDCKRPQNLFYRQIDPPFPNSKSSSYEPLPCGNHPLCLPEKCIGDSCSYHLVYDDESHSIGILAHENFAFPTSTRHEEIVRLVFGCGFHNEHSYAEERDLKSAGIFGLGWGHHSFVNQINSISQGRFSYCLPSAMQAAQGLSTFLQFGLDIPLYSTLPRTRLIKYQDDNCYHVNLLDISVNGERLNIPIQPASKGRCIFDSGSSMTRVYRPAYRIVRIAVEKYIARSVTTLQKTVGMFGFDTCFMASKPFGEHNHLPSITFHFEGNADLVLQPETVFHYKSHNLRFDYICLKMVPAHMTIIGTDAQANQFIVYDLHGSSIYFGPRDCSRNP